MHKTDLRTGLFLCLALAGCKDEKASGYNINRLVPVIVANAEEIHFGGIVVLYDDDEELQLVNAGRSDLEISSISVTDNEDGVYTVTPEEAVIEPDDILTVGVNFEPGTYLPYNRELVILSNDEETPELRLPIVGEGVDGPVPDIELTPQAVDFGEVAQGETSTKYFDLSNVGTGLLEILDVQIEGSADFELVTGLTGSAYQQEQSSTAIVNYSPTAEGGANATIRFTTNDPDETETSVILLGNGGGEFEYPVAAYNCPSEADPPTTVTFDARSSYDPNGFEPLLFHWDLLDQPSGSSTTFDENDLSVTQFFVDSSGDYGVQLVVENSIGLLSEPAQCSFPALPDESIQIELSWNTGNSDFDLHLVQYQGNEEDYPDTYGYPMFSFDHDCCWCSPNPSWGETGSADDPSLSLDNRVGYGPEVIHIEHPSEGTYGVLVHYFDDKGGGLTTATVRTYLDGLLISEEAVPMGQRDLWYVGDINWVGGNGSFSAANETPDGITISRCD